MSGHEDTKRTLTRRDWIKMPEKGMGGQACRLNHGSLSLILQI